MNLGVDIGAPRGSTVVAAEAGTVASVSSLPGYGSIVIVSHGGGLHTVYAELAGVSVSRGAKVSRGSAIGSSGENPELGPIVHFEVWKGRSRQNPLKWLR
jgi:murein DD-endopeptidase MepM/ murein hydrolase activator NlpD